jgi:hypothetical protein
MLQLKSRRRWAVFFPLFFISFLGCFLLSLPAETQAEANKVSFDAQAVLPDNQRSNASYYDLNVKPGTSQDLTIKLKNNSSRQVKVKVSGNNARTNQNGALDYSKHDQKLLGGPTFEEMISPPQTVTLQPAAEQTVTFKLKIPAAGFDGTVLGGFYCYEDTKEQEEKNEGFSLTNKFAYTIGAQLTCSDAVIKPAFALTKVEPGLDDGYLTIFATLENSQPVLMSQMEMKATVTKKGKDTPLREVQKTISFAPRTQFRLPISWENEPLKKGKYELVIQLKDASQKSWLLKKEFEIKGTDEKLNKEAVEVSKEKTDYEIFYGALFICFIIILGLIVYIVRLRQKQS